MPNETEKPESIVRGAKDDFFGKLPNYLINDPAFPADALAAALYLESKPSGWVCRPFDLRKRFGWGAHTWYRVSRILKAYGLLTETITCNGSILKFEITWQLVASKRPVEPKEQPVDKYREPTVDFRDSRKADIGKSTPLEEKENTNKDLTKKQTAAADDFEKLNAKATKLGIPTAGAIIQTLVKTHGIEKVTEKLSLLEQRKGIRNSSGWLQSALSKDYANEALFRGDEPRRLVPTASETEVYLASQQVIKATANGREHGMKSIREALKGSYDGQH